MAIICSCFVCRISYIASALVDAEGGAAEFRNAPSLTVGAWKCGEGLERVL